MNTQKEKTRGFKFCNNCCVLEPDVVLAMQDMTSDSLEFIMETAEQILKNRTKGEENEKL